MVGESVDFVSGKRANELIFYCKDLFNGLHINGVSIKIVITCMILIE